LFIQSIGLLTDRPRQSDAISCEEANNWCGKSTAQRGYGILFQIFIVGVKITVGQLETPCSHLLIKENLVNGKAKECWEIMNCGRQKGGPKVAEFGECVASKESMGHSCWAIAGTLCGGEVQGTMAQKEHNCIRCDVYKLYHRMVGSMGKEIQSLFPAEDAKYNKMLMTRMRTS